jgi:hypothetical protein
VVCWKRLMVQDNRIDPRVWFTGTMSQSIDIGISLLLLCNITRIA